MNPLLKSLLALTVVLLLATGIYWRTGQVEKSDTPPPPPSPSTLVTTQSRGFGNFLATEANPPAADVVQGLVRVARARDNVMSTVAEITVYAPDTNTGLQAIESAYDRILTLEQMMSPSLDDSEVRRINHLKAGETAVIPPELFQVLKRAVEMSELTGGAFDVTVQPLIDMYKQTQGKPSPQQIADALDRVGYRKMHLDEQAMTVAFDREGMAVTVGGIAKGFIVQEAAKVLRDSGLKHFMVAVAGDIHCVGGHPDGTPWTVGIQNPRSQETDPMVLLHLVDKSISTSGNYRRFTLVDGKLQSHILDPATGRPSDMENPLVSVTVLADDNTSADALATGLTVMGVKKGMETIRQIKGAEALFMELK